ncbi:MAG: YggT family protein [Chloroflexi bacterium]|nr:YggT family protein [Chloroflexota bacterium]
MDKVEEESQYFDKDRLIPPTEIIRTEPQKPSTSPFRKLFIERVIDFAWLLAGILEFFLGLRFVLKWAGADPFNPFAALLYQTTGSVLRPFTGLIRTPVLNSGGIVEINTLIAMAVYLFAAWVAAELIWILFSPPHPASSTSKSLE